ncbi:endopeptidase La [Helicobacter saguini]|uniref:Lon protease n=1 Tax=Helicobacter saguini TaxID=1548018 RepID=A0A347VQR1_9HELI|nr:endopeptidase La [Helicobacter saguini]MWV63194.1 endopeptidase La [Helicobacter saguini]MWV66136.1 endopeptidase La [Helicobacter saguini]MWV68486.1 endopeptidase La [Helicobacter saguini]MWV71960.1 endopeptidase La [Helicobacter saguini]TLD95968.1 endopeptidase La [Helicobacter saguini]
MQKEKQLKLPVIVEDEMFVFPFIITPIFISDKANMAAVANAKEGDEVFVVCAKNNAAKDDMPFYDVGVVGKVMRHVSLPDGRIKILFQGISKGRINEILNLEPLEASVNIITYKESNPRALQALLAVFLEKVNALAHLSQNISSELLNNIEGTDNPNKAIDLITPALRLKKEQSYKLFSSDDTEERLMLATQMVLEEIETQKLQKDIKSKVHTKMDQINREFFLKEQLKQIQKELGIDKQRDEEITQYYAKLEELKPGMSEDAYKEIKKQIDRLSRSHPDSSDANMVQNYVEWVLEIPFTSISHKALSIKNVASQLNSDHYSLEEPKERIIEYFGVKELLAKRLKEDSKKDTKKDSKKSANEDAKLIELNKKLASIRSKKGLESPLPESSEKVEDSKEIAINDKHKGTILCFYGPPGVGKTSLANSIALALNRPLVRIALGGLEDVNELRGHRRTYLGSMPGRIVQGLIDSKKMNPVMVLDEIDKITRGVRGDPTSVLLEILDPEQNVSFRDYYTNFSIDLSQVVFIATANDISMIPAPLRDRMEFIEISSYTPQEKYEIAKKYLIPQEAKNHGLRDNEVKISKEAIELMIHNYTREAGVRNLRRKIAQIMRKCAVEILSDSTSKVSSPTLAGKNHSVPPTLAGVARGGVKSTTKTKKDSKDSIESKPINITAKDLPKYLKKIVFEIDKADREPRKGVVNGLAWTAVGGDVLKVEAISLLGKGNLKLTGQLGDVMKESAYIAYSVVKNRLDNELLSSLRDFSQEKAKQSTKDSKNIESKTTKANHSSPTLAGDATFNSPTLAGGVKSTTKTKKDSKDSESKDDFKSPTEKLDIHLHVPEGATPKDGPSAGITMACAIASILFDKQVKQDVAMTGELNLSGEVLPIGGLKEKLIAAYKAEIKRALIPLKNYKRDLDDIPDEVKKHLQIIPVKTIDEVFSNVLI